MKVYDIYSHCHSKWPLTVWKEMQARPHEAEHRHNCYEIMIALADGGSCAVGARNYTVYAGSIFFCTPADSHAFSIPVGNQICNIMFTRDILSAAAAELLDKIPAGVYRIFKTEQLDQLCSMLSAMERELAEQNEGFECYSGAVMQFLLTSIYRRINDLPDLAGIVNDDEMEKTLDHIRRNYQEKITLESLGELIDRPASYVGKLFRKIAWCSFNKYILRYRIGRAQELLRNSKLSLTEIAYQTGFFDSAHFTKSFEKINGIAPLAYRRQTYGK